MSYPRPRGRVAAEPSPSYLPNALLSLLAAGCSRTVREPDRLLLLGPGAEGARRGQPGTRPDLPVAGACQQRMQRSLEVWGGVLWILRRGPS